ncbi:tetratricopeptide repeat protein [Thermodesulfobacteriota bacterium]
MSDHENEPIDTQEEAPKDPAQEDYDEGQKFLKDQNLPQAANAFHNALIGYQQSKNEPGIANASDKLGDICIEREDFEKAIPHYQRAYEICDRLDDISSIVSLEKKMASCHLGLGQFQETLTIYLKLFDTFTDWKNPGQTVAILEQIAELYIEMNEKEKAVDAFKTAASIHAGYGHPRHAQKLLDKAEEVLKG